MILAQPDQIPVVPEHRVLVGQRRLGVDLGVVGGGLEPGRAAGEACVGGGAPLHGGTGVVPGLGAENGEDLGILHPFGLLDGEDVAALHILIVIDALITRVGHADLLPLIDVGGALQPVQGAGQHLGGHHPMFALVAEAGDYARLVVVAPEQRRPPLAVHAALPVVEDALEFEEIERRLGPLVAVGVIHLEVVEVEHHGEFRPVQRTIALAVLETGGGHLPHRHGPHGSEDVAAYVLQKFVDAWPVCVEAAAIPHLVARERLILGDKVDDVEAETVDPLLRPEVDDLFHLGANRRVFPVEIRLLAGEQVQIVLAGGRVQLPGAAAKLGLPVVGHAAFHRIFPDVVVAVGAVLVPQRRLEPGVLGGGVVDHYVHHDADVAPVGGRQQGLEIAHGAVGRVYGQVVGDVVAVVHLGGDVDRGQPEGIDA